MDRRPRPIHTLSARAFCALLAVGQMVAASAGANHDAVGPEKTLFVSGWDDEASGFDEAARSSNVPVQYVDECGCGGCCCYCTCWGIRAGTILLGRGGDSGQTFLFDVNEIGKPGDDILNSRDFGDDWAGGPDLSITRCLGPCCSIEARYLGIDGWTTRSTHAGDVFVILPWTTVRGNGTVSYLNGADLYSVELNLRRWTNCWFGLLAGLRYIEYNEGLLMQFAPPGGAGLDVFAIDTNNHLFGGQIGAEAALCSIGPCRLDGWLKAGVYGNDADQSTSLLIPVPGAAGASGDRTAFHGSLGLSAYCPVTRRLGFWTGYQAMWLDGVALAPSQLAVTNVQNNFASVAMNEGVFFHGLTIGMDVRW